MSVEIVAGFAGVNSDCRCFFVLLAYWLSKKFSEINYRFRLIDERFNQIDKRFEEVEKRFGVIEERLEGVERRIVFLERRFNAFRDDGKAI
jgi:tetrahydromethanopterin S-methyltransferase subunit G